MHGIDAADTARLAFARKCDVCRRQRGVPIMAVHHLRQPLIVHALRQLARHPAEQCEAAAIVRIRLSLRILIRVTGACIQAGRVDHVSLHVQSGEAAAAQRHGVTPRRYTLAQHDCVLQIRQDRRKPWQQQTHIAAGQG